MAKKAEVTYSGYRPDQVRSALQKAIRRGETDNALHWLTELVLSGEEWWAWRTLLVIVSEDVGLAWPEGPTTIRALFENWRTTSEWLMAVHAVILLCRAPKSRLVDDALAAHLLGHMKEMRRPIPDEALDLHTVAGKYRVGRAEDSPRGQEHWWDEAGRIENEAVDPDADYYKALVKRWWAENRQYPEARRPEEFQKPPKKDYLLPLGVETPGKCPCLPSTGRPPASRAHAPGRRPASAGGFEWALDSGSGAWLGTQTVAAVQAHDRGQGDEVTIRLWTSTEALLPRPPRPQSCAPPHVEGVLPTVDTPTAL